MKKLPEIYKNKIKVSNNKRYFYSKEGDLKEPNLPKKEPSKSVSEVLESLWKTKTNAYTKKVTVVTKNKTFDTRLIQERGGILLTIDNEKIRVEDILSLEIHS